MKKSKFLLSLIICILCIISCSNNPITNSNGEKVWILDSTNIKIFNLGKNINTSGTEYAPTISGDGRTLYFVSDRIGSLLQTDGKTISHDFWSTKKNNSIDTTFLSPFNLDPSNTNGLQGVNTILNEGCGSITSDNNKLIFTACNRPNGVGSYDIYMSELKDNKWQIAINLGKNINSSYFDSQPAISADNKRIYFVSNRPGPNSNGGDSPDNFDIWYSDWDSQNNIWLPAINLEAINSKGEDASPFICSDGITLIFSSNGYTPNYGGLDFYSTKYDTVSKSWSKPKNLGQPINTLDDEMFFTMPNSNDCFYFSSQRTDIKGFQGYLDIYMGIIPDLKK